MDNVIWSNYAIKKIKETKKLILHKKIMMSFIVENYSFIDKIIKYTLIISATMPIILNLIISFLEKINTNDNNSINITIIILNLIVVGLIKFKEMSKFDKLKDLGKDQSIKYTQLYDKLERELVNRESKLSENEFLYWLSREYGNIELNDPDISFSLKSKFIENCKKKGIIIDDDYKILQDLLNEKTIYENNLNGQNYLSNLNGQNKKINNINNLYVDMNIISNQDNLNQTNSNNLNQTNSNISNSLTDLTNLTHLTNLTNLTNLSGESQNSHISIQSAFKENEYNKINFKKLSKKFNNNAGLNWAIERLKNDY
jgi:hypothetical protein